MRVSNVFMKKKNLIKSKYVRWNILLFTPINYLQTQFTGDRWSTEYRKSRLVKFSRIFLSAQSARIHRDLFIRCAVSTRITRRSRGISSSAKLPARVPITSQSRLSAGGRGGERDLARGAEPSIRTCMRFMYTGVSCTPHVHKRDARTRGDRAPQVSLGPHRHNTFTDVTPHSKLLRCRRTRISSLPPFLSLAPWTPPANVIPRACNRDAHTRMPASPPHLTEFVREDFFFFFSVSLSPFRRRDFFSTAR